MNESRQTRIYNLYVCDVTLSLSQTSRANPVQCYSIHQEKRDEEWARGQGRGCGKTSSCLLQRVSALRLAFSLSREIT